MSKVKNLTKRQAAGNPLASVAKLRPRPQQLAVALIDEPSRAMRETMDEGKLSELIESIRAHGLINPIAVKLSGERFEVLAGHRRFIAVKALGWASVTCMVYPEQLPTARAIKAAENTFREDVNPAEEARFLWEVCERECGNDTVTLAQQMGLRVDYVEARMNLVRGDADVLAALAKAEIGIGVAAELNLVRDPIRRRMLLQAAVDGGCSIAQMRQWRTQGNAIDALMPGPPIVEDLKAHGDGMAPVPLIECFFCGEGPQAGGIQTLYVHQPCFNHFNRLLERASGQKQESSQQ